MIATDGSYPDDDMGAEDLKERRLQAEAEAGIPEKNASMLEKAFWDHEKKDETKRTRKNAFFTGAVMSLSMFVAGLFSYFGVIKPLHAIHERLKWTEDQNGRMELLNKVHRDFLAEKEDMEDAYNNLSSFSKIFNDPVSLERAERFKAALEYSKEISGLVNKSLYILDIDKSQAISFDKEYLGSISCLLPGARIEVRSKKKFEELALGKKDASDILVHEDGSTMLSWLQAYKEINGFLSSYVYYRPGRYVNGPVGWQKLSHSGRIRGADIEHLIDSGNKKRLIIWYGKDSGPDSLREYYDMKYHHARDALRDRMNSFWRKDGEQ